MNAENNSKDEPIFEVDELCIFCPHRVENKTLAEYGTVVAIRDEYPVTKGHLLILTRRHTPDLFSMTQEEQLDMLALVRILRDQYLARDPSITGFNIGMNCGVSAGQDHSTRAFTFYSTPGWGRGTPTWWGPEG